MNTTLVQHVGPRLEKLMFTGRFWILKFRPGIGRARERERETSELSERKRSAKEEERRGGKSDGEWDAVEGKWLNEKMEPQQEREGFRWREGERAR